jgi:hypothetical protein
VSEVAALRAAARSGLVYHVGPPVSIADELCKGLAVEGEHRQQVNRVGNATQFQVAANLGPSHLLRE